MFRFAKDTTYSSVHDMLTQQTYPTIESIENAGFKIIDDLVIIPKNTPFKYLGDYTSNIHLEVFDEELLFYNAIEAIID